MKCVRSVGGDVWLVEMSSSVSSSSVADVVCFRLLSFGGDGLVERWFARSWSRWPFTMAMERGGWRRTRSEVSSGQVVKWPASIALIHVDSTGEKQLA